MPSKSEMLSEDDTKDLEKALGDSFDSFTSTAGEELLVDVSHIYPNPLFGSRLRIRLPKPNPDEKDAHEINQDWDSEDLDNFFEDFQIDDAPKWFDSNPFRFDAKAIREFFERRVEIIREEIRRQYEPSPTAQELEAGEDFPWDWSNAKEDPDDILLSYWPEHLSKAWFEINIFEEFEHLDFLLKIQEQHGKSVGHSSYYSVSVGRIGRMVEHYRWRFRFEADVIRGKKGLDSARAGGTERAKSTSLKRLVILKKMEEMVARGHSISSAARLSYQKGLGATPAANRKLWQRHKQK